MELKVHVDNTIRTVCGLSQYTTVEEIIKALVFSIKQSGNFVLIENFQTNKLSNRRLPRIMSPDEKPIEIIFSYLRFLDNDEDIEFHLVRTNEPECSQEDENFKSLISEIDEQQKKLDQQSKKLELLVKEIHDTEESNLDLINKNEIKSKEFFKRKLLILDLQRCLNQKKLDKLESNKEEFDVLSLNKEIELSLFLNAQHDYYKRKLDITYQNISSLEKDYERLKTEYNQFIESLPQIELLSQHSSDSSLKNQASFNFIESDRKLEMNKSKIIYLERSSSNLEQMIADKSKIVQNLEAEYHSLLKYENNVVTRLNDIEQTTSLFETSSSSEYMSDEAHENNASLNSSRNKRSQKDNYSKSVRFSRIRRLTRYDKSPARLAKNKYQPCDIHYF